MFHRQRGRGRTPRDGVSVGAAVAAVAGARTDIARFERELQRGQLSIAAELMGEHLIDRYIGVEIIAFLSERPRNRAREELGRAPTVNRSALGGFPGGILSQPAQHHELTAKCLERLENE